MKNENMCVLSDVDFKRAVGVPRDIFDIMLEEIKKNIRDFVRHPKLSRTDQLLMTLMYWREYRTEFHIGVSHGNTEAGEKKFISGLLPAAILQSDQHDSTYTRGLLNARICDFFLMS